MAKIPSKSLPKKTVPVKPKKQSDKVAQNNRNPYKNSTIGVRG